MKNVITFIFAFTLFVNAAYSINEVPTRNVDPIKSEKHPQYFSQYKDVYRKEGKRSRESENTNDAYVANAYSNQNKYANKKSAAVDHSPGRWPELKRKPKTLNAFGEMLISAVQNIQEDKVRQILVNPERISVYYRGRALYCAARIDCNVIIKQMLNSPEYMNDIDVNHRGMALYNAVGNGLEAIVKQMLDSSVYMNDISADYRGDALNNAVENGLEAIVKQMLDSSYMNDISADDRGMALYFAVENGWNAIVEQMLNSSVYMNDISADYRGEALYFAAYRGLEAIVKQMLNSPEYMNDISADDRGMALYDAVENGLEAIVKQMLDSSDYMNGIFADDRGYALYKAVENGLEAIVKQMLDSSVYMNDISADYRGEALNNAVENGLEAIVKQMLDSSYMNDISADDRGMALYFAVENGWNAIVEQMLNSSVYMNDISADYRGMALYFAAYRGLGSIVKQMLNSSVYMNDISADYRGEALNNAVENGLEAIVKQMLNSSVYMNGINTRFRGQALRYAENNGWGEIVQRELFRRFLFKLLDYSVYVLHNDFKHHSERDFDVLQRSDFCEENKQILQILNLHGRDIKELLNREKLGIISYFLNNFQEFITTAIVDELMQWVGRNGDLDSFKFLITNEQTKVLISQNGANWLLAGVAANVKKCKEFIEFLLPDPEDQNQDPLISTHFIKELMTRRGVDNALQEMIDNNKYDKVFIEKCDKLIEGFDMCGELFRENKQEELLMLKVLPFLDEQSLQNFRCSSKYCNKIAQQWDTIRKNKIIKMLESKWNKSFFKYRIKQQGQGKGQNVITFTNAFPHPFVLVSVIQGAQEPHIKVITCKEPFDLRENEVIGIIALMDGEKPEDVFSFKKEKLLSRSIVVSTSQVFQERRKFVRLFGGEEQAKEHMNKKPVFFLRFKREKESNDRYFLKFVFEFSHFFALKSYLPVASLMGDDKKKAEARFASNG